MAMKQTQTKQFDFSDSGLDFSPGSKNLFPERFKRMFVTGYNIQTVIATEVIGNQVTLSYGGAHNYAAERVLKIDSGDLTGINGGEFWIDSVTIDTVTFTLDDGPGSISSGFSTRIAPLGWSLEYESGNIHVYKFKALDESDLYIRLCFQNQAARRNCISPCIGKSFDTLTGEITDEYAFTANKAIATPGTNLKWEFQTPAANSHDDWTYSQGLSTYGLAKVVGSLYHLIFLTNGNTGSQRAMINGVLPCSVLNYEMLQYPILLGYVYGSMTAVFDQYEARNQRPYIGNILVGFNKNWTSPSTTTSVYAFPNTPATSNYLPSEIDTFNTTTAEIPLVYEQGTQQFLGVAYGLYLLRNATTTLYATAYQSTPVQTFDTDLNNILLVHPGGSGNSESANSHFIVVPVEEVKIGY